MVRGHHDRRGGHHRVRDDQPAPPAGGHPDHAPRDEYRPAHVQGGHGGELVRQVGTGSGAVGRGSEQDAGVGQPVLRQHPRRRERVADLDRQADGRGDHQRRAGARPAGAVPPPHPQQEQGGGREVHPRVVVVGGDRQRVRPHRPALRQCLAGQAEDAFHLPQCLGVADRDRTVTGREVPARLVHREEQPEQQHLNEAGTATFQDACSGHGAPHLGIVGGWTSAAALRCRRRRAGRPGGCDGSPTTRHRVAPVGSDVFVLRTV